MEVLELMASVLAALVHQQLEEERLLFAADPEAADKVWTEDDLAGYFPYFDYY